MITQLQQSEQFKPVGQLQVGLMGETTVEKGNPDEGDKVDELMKRQNEMMEAIRLAMIGKSDAGEEVVEMIEDKKRNSPLVAGCFTICGFGPDDENRPK